MQQETPATVHGVPANPRFGDRAPKRVALVSDWCLPRRGGIETHLMALAGRLTERGLSPTIITSYPGPDSIDGIAIDRIDCLRLPYAPIALSPGLVGKVRRSLEKGGYDLVHVHCSIVAPLCFAALPAARSLGLPMLVTFHSVMNTMPRFLALSDPLLGWTRPDVTLTAVSSLVAAQAVSALRGTRASTLPNGYDGAFWRAARPRSKEDGTVQIVTALRLQGRKRPLALVEAFATAARSIAGKGVDMRLTIAGDGPQRAAIERRVASLGLEGKITLTGWQSREALRELYEAASLFVMPSRKEAFCIAALEARAAGLPVVAFAGTGIADFIRNNENGVLVQNDAALAETLASLSLDPTRLARLVADTNGLDRYDWNALADEHVVLYARCLETGTKAKAAPGA
jgi:glycosyltransferase involved in cell wall biosynthesis